jgi:4-hydroxybenzoate polyprenyltransferase
MKIKAFLKLIRIWNVLLIGLTQILMRYAIIAPILLVFSMELKLSFVAFISYVLATMLIAAAGYAINDYYDHDLDLINRDKDDVVVGSQFAPAVVLWVYRILNAIALILAAFASYKSGISGMVFCFVIIIGLLYFYTTTYKKQLFIGNLIVALVTAMVPLVAYVLEMSPVLSHYKVYIISGHLQIIVITMWILGFSVFAFLTALTRELIKDMEDFEGDRIVGRNTLPIAFGINSTRWISISLLFLILIGLVVLYFLFFVNEGIPDFITLVYFTAFLIVPISYNIYHLIKAKDVKDYKFCGDLLKLIMLLGVLYAVVVRFIIHKTFGV